MKRAFRLLAMMVEAGSNTCIEGTADLGTVRVQVYFRPIPGKYCVEIRGHSSSRWETCYEFPTYPPARRAFYRTLRKM